MLKILTFAVLVCGIAGCATTTVNISSSPAQATVRIRPLNGAEFRDFGQTPITLSASQISGSHISSGPAIVELQRAGYQTERILLTEFSHVDLNIHQELKPIVGLEDPRTLNNTVDRLFDVQKMAKQGRFDEALAILSDLERATPQIAAIYELRAGIYYLQKKYVESFENYVKVLEMNPQNTEAQKMHDTLKPLVASTAPKSGANK